MERRQREARQLKQDQSIIDHLMSGPVKPRMPIQAPVAEPAESTREEKDARELREALFKRWTSAKGGGLADF
jgi:hypothetical protein